MRGMEFSRERLGLSRMDIAESLCVKPHTVFRWEKGTRNPDLGTLKRLSALLGESVDFLISEVSSNAPVDERSDLKTLQRRLCDLIGAIEKLHSECDTPEEVMRLLLDVGDNGEINHPENRAFIDLLETLAPLAGEILRSIRRGERVAS